MDRRVAILAGGQSRRMGRDKASLRVDGIPLLERIAKAAQAAGAEVMIVGRTSDPENALKDAVFVPDAFADQGPLGGLATALDHAPPGGLLLTACDMPNLTAHAFAWLFRQAATRTLDDGLVVWQGEAMEPLFAIYTTRCRALVANQIARGQRSMRALIAAGRFLRADATPEIANALVNVNTPQELAAFRSATS